MRALLMGGQACVLYGAAEFSRDTDLAIPASAANFERLAAALRDLRAEVISRYWAPLNAELDRLRHRR